MRGPGTGGRTVVVDPKPSPYARGCLHMCALGRTGIEVSPYCPGTPGSPWRVPQVPWGTRALAPSTSAKRLRLAETVNVGTGGGEGGPRFHGSRRAGPAAPPRVTMQAGPGSMPSEPDRRGELNEPEPKGLAPGLDRPRRHRRGRGSRRLALSPGATSTEFFDVIGTDAADGGSKRQSPEEVVATALRALDRRTPPPTVVSGRLNRVMASLGRGLSRRRAVLLMGSMTAAR